jgi:uncharacterized lipoprotein YmbA
VLALPNIFVLLPLLFRAHGKDWLRNGAIVYKTSPEQIGFYNYQRWATDPRELVTNAVADHLRASGNFTQVKPYRLGK